MLFLVLYKPMPVDGGPLEIAFFEGSSKEDATRQAVNRKTAGYTTFTPQAKERERRCMRVLGAGEFGEIG